MNPISLASFLHTSTDMSFSNNRVGYLYNIKEQKYFNCDNESNKNHIMPILATIPSGPWIVKKSLTPGSFIFKCTNEKVIDIAWGESIIVYSEHGKYNQQFRPVPISSNKLDEFFIQFVNDKKQKFCFASKMGRVVLGSCSESKLSKTGQNWYWIPENLYNEMVLKPMMASLDK
ncbi:hypothetical protein CDIK_1073 [Cucumispora dikerogammari]|nr:hypothetical protein CDIK_1073 [Cucumispora dikerogammari]